MKESELQQDIIRLLPRLRRFARALDNTSDGADDLVQDTVECALRQLHEFGGDDRLDWWLFRIMETTWRQKEMINEVNEVRHLDGAGTEHKISVDGVHSLQTHVMLGAVREAVRSLPADQRAALILVCVEGFKYREVAEILGIPIGTVTSRLARARLAIHRQLHGKGKGASDTSIRVVTGSSDEIGR